MKLYGQLLLLAALASASTLVAGDVTSRTYFSPRTTSSDAGLELTLSNYNIWHSDYPAKPYLKPVSKGVFLTQGNYFYQESNSGSDLANYFGPNDCGEISIREDGCGTVGSQFVGLETTTRDFNEVMQIRPERRVYGNLWNVHFDASEQIDGLWMNVMIPIVRAKHNPKLECCGNGPSGELKNCYGDCIQNCEDAFNNREWVCGKISNHRLSTSGIDDVQVKLGWNFWNTKRNHLGIYGVGLIPTGGSASAHYLFEPQVGTRSAGLGLGTNLDWEFASINNAHFFNFMFDLKWRYQFSADQRRSFDLCNGPWSRYLSVGCLNSPEKNAFGINYFTDTLRVRPGSMVDFWTALHYHYEEWNVEVGYNLWWREEESVRLGKNVDLCCRNIVIYDWASAGEQPPASQFTSANCATINQARFGENVTPHDAQKIQLSNSQIDLRSATHGSALSHKFSFGASYNTHFIDHPSSFGIGGSYEFGSNNKALDQWAVYYKSTFGF